MFPRATSGWIVVLSLGGIVGVMWLVSVQQWGAIYEARLSLASRLPGGSLLRECLLHPDTAVARLLDRIARNPVRWALTMVFLGIVIGGTLESLIEDGQSMPDGWWWAFVSMTTVGYGDIAPKTDVMRFLAAGVIATGIASTAILTAALAGRIAESRMAAPPHALTPEIHDDLQAVIERERENAIDLERLLPLVSDPRVIAALRIVHEEKGAS
jgi:hypothetical protein